MQHSLEITGRFFIATARVAIKLIVEFSWRIVNLLVFWIPVQRKLYLQISVLRDEHSIPVLDAGSMEDLQRALTFTCSLFKKQFDIELKPFKNSAFIEIKDHATDTAILDLGCDYSAFKNEWGKAGSYFSKHQAGWNFLPKRPTFPVQVFIVRSIGGKIGCSLGVLTDYVTLSVAGTSSLSTLAHEIGHSCGLLHRSAPSNLMNPSASRRIAVNWWQKLIVRSSRHCAFW